MSTESNDHITVLKFIMQIPLPCSKDKKANKKMTFYQENRKIYSVVDCSKCHKTNPCRSEIYKVVDVAESSLEVDDTPTRVLKCFSSLTAPVNWSSCSSLTAPVNWTAYSSLTAPVNWTSYSSVTAPVNWTSYSLLTAPVNWTSYSSLTAPVNWTSYSSLTTPVNWTSYSSLTAPVPVCIGFYRCKTDTVHAGVVMPT
ncbi:unnamed protein product [Mytilus coruscus]|uniref:Uncharacterized protein n=1 Tax=Mytilus coruscus TaxID=42192 RepID=A0A6J7ZU43_MYTCO|nr:unnamed protein product [Mytilus coruscus]